MLLNLPALLCLTVIKGVLHPNQKLACFVLYLNIINIFLKKKNKQTNSICNLEQIVQGIQKWN